MTPRPYALSGNTLVEALDSIVATFPDSTASFPGTNQVMTLAALSAAADRVGSTLLDAGVERGEVVGVLMSTRAEFLTSLFGIVRIGAVCSILPTPAGFSPAAGHIVRLAKIADTAQMKRIIADETFAPAVALIAEHTTETTPTLIDLEALTRDAGPLPEPPLPSDEAVVQFTSGSTADPKGVILTHGELTAGLLACAVSGEFSPDDVFTQWVPHFHDMGLVGLLSHLLNGASVHVFSPLYFIRNADKMLRHLSEQRVTVFTSPNFGYDHLCSVATPELVSELDLSAWRLAFNGAEPIRAESVERFASTFAAAGLSQSAMYPVYGMAEATLAICFPPPGTKPRIEWVGRAELGRSGRAVPATPESLQAKGIVSVGKPVHGIAVRIVDADGNTRGEGELGDIQISGPPVSRGYYRNAAATAESRDGDWFRTGDLGLCLNGDFFVTGRRKDMIVVRGQNYFAEDVELVARDVEGVYKQNCVAFADTRDEGSECLTVLVEVSAKTDAHELVGHVLDKVRSSLDVDAVRVHAVPPRWIPKTTSGKWKRSAARDEIVSGTDSVIATSPAPGR